MEELGGSARGRRSQPSRLVGQTTKIINIINGFLLTDIYLYVNFHYQWIYRRIFNFFTDDQKPSVNPLVSDILPRGLLTD